MCAGNDAATFHDDPAGIDVDRFTANDGIPARPFPGEPFRIAIACVPEACRCNPCVPQRPSRSCPVPRCTRPMENGPGTGS